jgi:protein-L-isoaspartate O-methyltransferase
MDNPDYILIYSQELLDVEYDSILIGGLGLGTQAYVSQDFAQVDVVEIDQNVIDINNELGYLNSNVNIINDDILTYTPTKTYDIIVLDIWWEGLTEELTDTLTTKYLPFVNEGGFLYFPINLGVLSSKVKILK